MSQAANLWTVSSWPSAVFHWASNQECAKENRNNFSEVDVYILWQLQSWSELTSQTPWVRDCACAEFHLARFCEICATEWRQLFRKFPRPERSRFPIQLSPYSWANLAESPEWEVSSDRDCKFSLFQYNCFWCLLPTVSVLCRPDCLGQFTGTPMIYTVTKAPSTR